MGNVLSRERANAGNQFLKLAQCRLVAEKVLSYLSPGDLKLLSLVSKDALAAVRKSDQFSDHFQIHISRHLLNNDNLLVGDSFAWRHVLLEFTPAILEGMNGALEEVLEEVESLQLYVWFGSLPTWQNLKCLEAVLTKAKKLRWLAIDDVILGGIPSQGFFSKREIQRVVAGLHGLEIVSQNKTKLAVFHALENMKRGLALPRETLLRMATSKPISIRNNFHINNIGALIKANAGSLEELHVHYKMCNWEELAKLECLELKRLKITGDGRAESESQQLNKSLKRFLNRLSALEELDISLKGSLQLGILLGLIAHGKLNNLKKFHLTGKHFTVPNGAEGQVLVQWSYLEGMAGLRDFSFSHRNFEAEADPDYLNGVGEKILKALPPSIIKISIQADDFWEDLSKFDNIGVRLARFDNLRELCLVWCTDAVTDEGFQTLIASCPKITSINLTHSSFLLTDFGLTGVRPNGEVVGRSLSEWRGLERLTFHLCERITPGAILRAVRFQSLRFIQFCAFPKIGDSDDDGSGEGSWEEDESGDEGEGDDDTEHGNEIPEELMFQLVRNNPSLETVRLSPIRWEYEPDSDAEDEDADEFDPEERLLFLEKKLKQGNPRLKVVELDMKPWWDRDLDDESEDDGGNDSSDEDDTDDELDDFVAAIFG